MKLKTKIENICALMVNTVVHLSYLVFKIYHDKYNLPCFPTYRMFASKGVNIKYFIVAKDYIYIYSPLSCRCMSYRACP